MTTAERLANIAPHATTLTIGAGTRRHRLADGLHLIRNGRDLIFYITRARTPMPKSTREYISRCEIYRETGHAPLAFFCHD